MGRSRSILRPGIILLLVAFLATVAFARKEFAMPKAAPAATYPSHDNHPKEKVAFGADPYSSGKSSPFSTRFDEHGLLPVFLVVTNDGDQPVELANMQVQFVTSDRHAKIEPSTNEDIYRRLSKTTRRGDEPRRNPLPIPLPGGGPKVGVKKDVREEVEAAQFRARAVMPHETQSGFVFFDISGLTEPLKGARLYVTGVRDGDGNELMYFEIPLDRASVK